MTSPAPSYAKRWWLLVSSELPSRSALPFIPLRVKIICLAVLLFNWRSWPFVWHWRVFHPFLKLRLSQICNNMSLLKSKREKELYLRSQIPIGENPLTKTVVWKDWAHPADCDVNMHLSNSSYPKALDSARLKYGLGCLSPYLRHGCTLAMGGTHFNFMREIPIGSPYEIRMQISCWDEKWIYLTGQYVISGSSVSAELSSKLRRALKSEIKKNTSNVVFDRVKKSVSYGAPNLTGTPSSPLMSASPSVSPSSDPLSRIKAKESMTTLPDGSILACTSVSLICCKYGRSTITPDLALATCGFLLSNEEWDQMQELGDETGLGNPNGIMELLKGGWRDVVATDSPRKGDVIVGDGVWWKSVVMRKGVQEEVDRRLKTLIGIREAMETVRSLSMVSA